MKTILLFVALLCVITLSSSSVPTASGAAKASGKERAVIQFTEPVLLMGVKLKGEYLFVHDEQRMARGEACTLVYKGTAELPGQLVLSFHCIPFPNTRAAHFTVWTVSRAPGQHELSEFQFPGSSELHRVPSGDMAHLNIVP